MSQASGVTDEHGSKDAAAESSVTIHVFRGTAPLRPGRGPTDVRSVSTGAAPAEAHPIGGRLWRVLRVFLPMPHFMGLAPLDAWVRLLLFPFVWVKPVYWPRLAIGLVTSAFGTAITLPERLLLAPLLGWLGRRSGHRLRHKPGVVIVLGYPRSGTTHLHYLMACDPRFWTPRWYQALAPQGFLLSWTALRVLLVPFLSNTRLMDDMAFGPEWPAEDEFAINNWCVASYLPGRLILPGRLGHYHRFHDLDGLTAPERSRWRRYSWAFAWKLSRLAGRRAILLKSPSHTARVRELADLYSGNVKFVHISRDPRAVVRSNVSMLERAEVYHLQGTTPSPELERGLIGDLVATEEKYQREAAELPPGRLAEVRYQDLVADPVAQMRRIYRELSLDWTPDVESRLVRYLHTVADYKAATPAGRAAGLTVEAPELDVLARESGLDRPTVEKRPLPPPASAPGRRPRGWPALVAATIAIAAVWLVSAYVFRYRFDWVVWPAGAVIGYVAVRAARAGSAWLGLGAVLATLAVFLIVAWPATYLAQYFGARNPHSLAEKAYHAWLATREGMIAENNIPYLLLGLITAYRFASRKHVLPPGSA